MHAKPMHCVFVGVCTHGTVNSIRQKTTFHGTLEFVLMIYIHQRIRETFTLIKRKS